MLWEILWIIPYCCQLLCGVHVHYCYDCKFFCIFKNLETEECKMEEVVDLPDCTITHVEDIKDGLEGKTFKIWWMTVKCYAEHIVKKCSYYYHTRLVIMEVLVSSRKNFQIINTSLFKVILKRCENMNAFKSPGFNFLADF